MIFSHPPYASDGAAPYLDEARGAIVLLLILMNIAINTVSASLLGAKGNSLSSTVKFIISMPAVYAIFAAAAVRIGGIALEQTFLWPVLSHFTGAFIILTTITAGAQLHRTPIGRPDLFTIGTSINKLFLSPLIAFAIIMLAGVFTPVTAQVFFIYAAVPSSFSLILFAVDYNCCPHRVAKSILYSSAFGLVTLTCAIRLAQYLFPAGV